MGIKLYYLIFIGCVACIALDPAWFMSSVRLLSVFETDDDEDAASGAPPTCPAVIQKRKGVYNTSKHDAVDGLRNVVILTAASMKFEPFLRNWEMHAEEMGLQWVVLAFDRELYDSRGGKDSSLLISSESQIAAAGTFRSKSYNKLVCNKIRMVKDILEHCDVDIMFSDADAVLLKDPFEHDLGKMIQSTRNDYIYQTNDIQTANPREHSCVTGTAANEGNTGFHYLRPTKNMIAILDETLQRCDEPENELDDQALMWTVIREAAANKTWHHCPAHAHNMTLEDSPIEEGTSQYCCLDPYYYPTGRVKPEKPDDLVMFHANWCFGLDEKETKLAEWTVNGWSLPRTFSKPK